MTHFDPLNLDRVGKTVACLLEGGWAEERRKRTQQLRRSRDENRRELEKGLL